VLFFFKIKNIENFEVNFVNLHCDSFFFFCFRIILFITFEFVQMEDRSSSEYLQNLTNFYTIWNIVTFLDFFSYVYSLYL